jgi:hypothetical protein
VQLELVGGQLEKSTRLDPRQDTLGNLFVGIESSRHPLFLFLLHLNLRLPHKRSALLGREDAPDHRAQGSESFFAPFLLPWPWIADLVECFLSMERRCGAQPAH